MADPTPGRSLGGRFDEATDALLEQLNRSIDLDQRLWPHDIQGSRAHARMLSGVGLITSADLGAIEEGLDAVSSELEAGQFEFKDSDEDIHMAVERRLTELVGEPARRLHTGRSRNDQVMLDAVLWLREFLTTLDRALVRFIEALLDRATEGAEQPMPALTHSQPAQVSSVGQWLVGHAAAAERNLRRARDLRGRLDECPLGSGAAAGSYLPLDRDSVALELGFDRPTLNAVQTTGGRSDVLDAVGLLGLVGVDLSRLGEELVLYAAPQYGWIRLPDRLTTGSSLLPHKKNPDGAELIRGAGKLLGTEFSALSTVIGGLVSGYSKDLQHDKEILFRAADRALSLLQLAEIHIEGLSWCAERCRASCTPQLAALWLADRLVLEGMPFRAAHQLIGKAAREAEQTEIPLAEVLSGMLPEAYAELREQLTGLTVDQLLGELKTAGSAAPSFVAAQIASLRERIGPE